VTTSSPISLAAARPTGQERVVVAEDHVDRDREDAPVFDAPTPPPPRVAIIR
jgi:hypothetical protein